MPEEPSPGSIELTAEHQMWMGQYLWDPLGITWDDHLPALLGSTPFPVAQLHPEGAKTSDWPLDLLRGECRSHQLPVSQGLKLSPF